MNSAHHLGMKPCPRIQIPLEQQDECLDRTESGDGVAHLYYAALHVGQRGLFCLSATYIWCGTIHLILTDMFSIFNTASHLRRIVWERKVLLFTCIWMAGCAENLIIVRYVNIRTDGHIFYLGAECWLFKHNRAVAELLYQTILSLNRFSDISLSRISNFATLTRI